MKHTVGRLDMAIYERDDGEWCVLGGVSATAGFLTFSEASRSVTGLL